MTNSTLNTTTRSEWLVSAVTLLEDPNKRAELKIVFGKAPGPVSLKETLFSSQNADPDKLESEFTVVVEGLVRINLRMHIFSYTRTRGEDEKAVVIGRWSESQRHEFDKRVNLQIAKEDSYIVATYSPQNRTGTVYVTKPMMEVIHILCSAELYASRLFYRKERDR